LAVNATIGGRQDAGHRPDHLHRPIAVHFGLYDVHPHDRDIERGFDQ